MVICYLGIGSNLGNRRKNIKLSLEKIRKLEGTKILKVSRIIETNPQGGPAGQSEFLNACLKIKTRLTPLNLLKQLKIIEKELGRAKTVRWGPRTIDLDILFYGDKLINRKDLKVPHPMIWEREFVLRPLREIAPELEVYCSSEPRRRRGESRTEGLLLHSLAALARSKNIRNAAFARSEHKNECNQNY